MARPSLLDRLALPDAFLTYNWRVNFPRIPGVADTRGLSVRAVSTNIPGFQIEKAEQQFPGGVKIGWAGQAVWEQQWNVTLIETRDMLSRESFLSWMLAARNPHTNTGMLKNGGYAVPAELELYDDQPLVIRRLKLVNCFPTNVGQISLDASSGVAQLPVDFHFDLVEEYKSAE